MYKHHVTAVRALARLLDSEFKIFGFRFGLDPLLGLIPGIGDIISTSISIYVIYVARKVGVPENKLMQMWRNVIIDFVIGFVPFVGDIGDFAFKANQKNIQIIKPYLDIDIQDTEKVVGLKTHAKRQSA